MSKIIEQFIREVFSSLVNIMPSLASYSVIEENHDTEPLLESISTDSYTNRSD